MTVEVRDSSYATYVGASSSWTSQAGDLAVILVASQYGTTNAHAPSGWTEVHTASDSSRAGYVATRWVTDPSDTQDIDMLAGAEGDSARLRARGMSISGVGSFEVTGWQASVPTVSGTTLVASQRHGAAGTGAGVWDVTAASVGEYSTETSWSILLSALVSTAPTPVSGEEPQLWCAVSLSAESDETSDERLTSTGPAVTRVVPQGAASITDLFSGGEPAIIAHRGGAANFPEGSAMAYTRSVVHGAPALEVSCHKTSDDVWFVCHDVSLHRIDSTAPYTDVREMTWAQVSQYSTMGQPILRLDDLLEAYADSHVLIMDPKNSALAWESMVEGLDKSRVILKFSGDATWLASQWHAAGWTTWGYYYEANLAQDWFQASTEYWDYLGMEIGASSSTWDTMEATGKPLIAHIAYDASDITAARTLPVVGIMTSDVAEALPLEMPVKRSELTAVSTSVSQLSTAVAEIDVMPLWCYMASAWSAVAAGADSYINVYPTTAVDTTEFGSTMVALGLAVQGQTTNTPYPVTSAIVYISATYAVVHVRNLGEAAVTVRPRLVATAYNYLYH